MKDYLDYLLGRKIHPYIYSSFFTLFFIALGLLLVRISNYFIKRIVSRLNRKENNNRIKTIETFSTNFMSSLIWILMFSFIFYSWGISLIPLLAGAGIIGIFIGIGSQSILKDVINGFVILSSGLINIGDKVKIKEFSGTIRHMTINNLILENNNNMIIVPNGIIDIIEKNNS
jgi:small conductance mechanosensitive channel